MNSGTVSETAAACLLCAALGFMAGAVVSRNKPPRPEPPAPAIIHADGSRTLERTNEPPPPPLPEPPQTVARVRSVEIELEPIKEPTKIRIDETVQQDGSHRFTVNGQGVIGGRDFAIMPAAPPPTPPRWRLGATWDGKNYGGIFLHDSGPVSYGIQASRTGAAVVLMVRF